MNDPAHHPEDHRDGYRALLVDYGGVLTTSMSISFAAFCLANGVDPDRLRAVLAAAYSAEGGAGVPANDVSDLVAGVETGRVDPAEFDRRLAVALSEGLARPIPPEGLTSRLFAELRPEARMRGAIAEARRRGIVTGLVSNTWGVTRPEDVGGLFDVLVLSGRERMRKPEAGIYLLAAERAGIAPEASVFVDDLPVNVQGARSVGMAGVLHRDPAITVPKLEGLLGVALASAGPN